MADHPLRPATDHRLGRPLPHQPANPTRAPPVAINLSRIASAYAVLAEVSLGYPPQQGRFPRATHPCATRGPGEPRPRVRLACVKHAASVRSEPGSNSHVQSQQTRHPQEHRLSDSRPVVTGPGPALKPRPNQGPPNAHARCHPAPCLAAQDKVAPRRATGSPCRRPRIPSFTNNVNQQPRCPAPSRITPPGDPPAREDAYMAPPPTPSTPFPKNLNHPPPPPQNTQSQQP